MIKNEVEWSQGVLEPPEDPGGTASKITFMWLRPPFI